MGFIPSSTGVNAGTLIAPGTLRASQRERKKNVTIMITIDAKDAEMTARENEWLSKKRDQNTIFPKL